jgi:hypothetical protein
VVAAFDVWPGLEPYAEAFDTLSNGRTWAVGMGGAMPVAIAHHEMLAYAEIEGFAETTDALRYFCQMIRAQDQAWLADWGERAARKGRNGTPHGKRTP